MNLPKRRSRTKLLISIIGAVSTIALIGWAVAYQLQAPRRHKEQSYKNPAMAKWLQYFKIDVKSRTHPFQIARIAQDGSNKFWAELPFNWEFLEEQGWGGGAKEFQGKFLLVINGRNVWIGGWEPGPSGNCIFRFRAEEPHGTWKLSSGTNQVRFDIYVNNPKNIEGWVLAEGPSTELAITNSVR